MTTFIKPYSFSDFVDKSWSRWKFHALHDAFVAANQLQLKLMAENEDASGYAYAGNVSNMPILWDKDDYKFLCQFLPDDWNKALTWRYNEGLLLASEAREGTDENPNPEKSIEAVKNEQPELVISGNKIPQGGTRVYKQVWTGMRDLVLKLEAPHRRHAEHRPNSIHPKSGGELKDGPGLKDIDPWETDPTHPKHHSHYLNAGGGLYNYDLSGPIRVSDDYIDKIPDNQIEIPKDTPNDAKSIADAVAKKRLAMKKNPHHTFSGFSVLQPGPTASKKIHDWKRAQGLGLLGDVGDKFIDPHTGQEHNVSYKMPADNSQGFWSSHSGSDGTGKPLKMPVIYRKLNYEQYDKKGKLIPKAEEATAMPVLLPGKTLPRIPSYGPHALTMKQREEFARRRGFWPAKAAAGCPKQFKAGMSYEDLAQVCGAALNAGAPGNLTFLLKNIDVLTDGPDGQIEFMKKNRRDAIHLAAAKHGNNLCPQCRGKKVITNAQGQEEMCPHCVGTGRDPWSIITTQKDSGMTEDDGEEGEGKGKKKKIKSEAGYYVVGHTSNKNIKGFEPSDLTAEQMSKVWEKYQKELKIEALSGISRWLSFAKKVKPPIPIQVRNMIKSAEEPLVDVIAMYLCLALNTDKYGIYDPSVQLTGVIKSRKEAYTLETENPQEIAKALVDEELPKMLQHLGGSKAKDNSYPPKGWNADQKKGQPGALRMSYQDAQNLAAAIIEANKHYKYFPEKISTYPIHWIMEILERKGLATQDDPNDEDVDDDKGRDVENDILSSKSRSEWRINKASNDTWTFAQRAYGSLDMGRRERERNPGKMELSGGAVGGSTKASQAGGDKKGGLEDFASKGYSYSTDLGSIATDWLTRRGQLKPDTGEVVTQGQLLPTIKGMTDYLATFRQRVQANIGDQAAQQLDGDIQDITKIAQEQPEQAVEEENEDDLSEFEKQKNAAWPKFLQEVIAGQKSPIPMNKEEQIEDEDGDSSFEHVVELGPPIDLATFAGIFKLSNAENIITTLNAIWSGYGCAKWAVPLLMALTKVDEPTAIAQVEKAGVVPVQKKKLQQQPQQPVKMPQPGQAQPAVAATDVTSMLSQLATNPGLLKDLQDKKQELMKPENQQAVAAARKALTKKAMTGPLSPEESNVWYWLNSIAKAGG